MAKKNIDTNLLLIKVSIVLSFVAILICIGIAIYCKFIIDDNDIMVWLVLGLGNMALMLTNIANYKKK